MTDAGVLEFYSYQELLCANCGQQLNEHDFPGGPCLAKGFEWCRAFVAPAVEGEPKT